MRDDPSRRQDRPPGPVATGSRGERGQGSSSRTVLALEVRESVGAGSQLSLVESGAKSVVVSLDARQVLIVLAVIVAVVFAFSVLMYVWVNAPSG
jgi:hypothetical protein